MSPITLDCQLDDECLDRLKRLEHEMFMANDSRSTVLREVLDLLWMYEIIDDDYHAPKLKLECDTKKKRVKMNPRNNLAKEN